jgi:hypothetical protein
MNRAILDWDILISTDEHETWPRQRLIAGFRRGLIGTENLVPALDLMAGDQQPDLAAVQQLQLDA